MLNKDRLEQRIGICETLIKDYEVRGDPFKAISQLKEDIDTCRLAIHGISLLEGPIAKTLDQIQALTGATGEGDRHEDSIVKLRKIRAIVMKALDQLRTA